MKIPHFATKEESIAWVIANKRDFDHQKKNFPKQVDFSGVLIDGFDAQKGMLANSSKKLECLIYEAEIKRDRNEYMFEQYKAGRVLNHSVGMRYIKYVLCVDSNEQGEASYKENWDKYYPIVVNKKLVDQYGWFWAVLESKNIEGSAVVKGSNFLTPVLDFTLIDENTASIKAIINVCGICDSHMDVHIPNCWNKTLNENNYDLLLQEHEMEFDKVIADSITDKLTVYTENISITQLNSRFKASKNIEPGNTTQSKEAGSTTSGKNKLLSNFI